MGAASRMARCMHTATQMLCYAVRARYKDNPTLSKGPFCAYSFEVSVLSGYPFREIIEVASEEDVDVESTHDGTVCETGLIRFSVTP